MRRELVAAHESPTSRCLRTNCASTVVGIPMFSRINLQSISFSFLMWRRVPLHYTAAAAKATPCASAAAAAGGSAIGVCLCSCSRSSASSPRVLFLMDMARKLTALSGAFPFPMQALRFPLASRTCGPSTRRRRSSTMAPRLLRRSWRSRSFWRPTDVVLTAAAREDEPTAQATVYQPAAQDAIERISEDAVARPVGDDVLTRI